MADDSGLSEAIRLLGETLKFIDEHKDDPIQVSSAPEPVEIYVRANYCKTCGQEGVDKRASYSYEGEKQRLYCAKHKQLNMVNVKDKKCIFQGCKKQPNYNIAGQTKGLYCVEHKQPDMIDVKNKKCQFQGCKKCPTYNIAGQLKGLYCVSHKQPNMIDIKHKKCLFQGCKKRPIFNTVGHLNGLYCVTHKQPDMINVKDKTCQFQGCKKQPIFNTAGQLKGIYCAEHKQPDMIDVKNKKCIFQGCKKQPKFNIMGQLKGLYCAEHKLPDMVNVISKICQFQGCKKRPNFNISGQLDGIYCVTHKQPDMVDVKNKKCRFQSCKRRPTYGLPLQLKTLCTEHRLEGMIRNPKQKCISSGCVEYAFYGYTYSVHCETHKLLDEVNMVEKKCSKCGLIMVLNAENLCQYCGEFTHKKVHLVKQTDIKNFFDANELKYDSYDKVYDRECGLERPDFVFDRKEFVIIVEVDENQHGSYLETCECQRMVNIYNSFGGARVMFIRYNPDKYIGEQYTDNQRKLYLKEWVNWALSNPVSTPLSFVKLFFDGFEVSKTLPVEIPTI